MSLKPKIPGSNTEKSYFTAIGIKKDDLSLTKIPYEPEDKKIDSFLKKFVSEYDKYARAGKSIPLGLLLPAGGDKSILEKAFLSTAGGGADNSVLIGTAFANYWATMFVDSAKVAPGNTEHLSTLNNSVALTAAFIAAVKASYTTSLEENFFETLVKNVEAVVKTIIWTLTQTGPAPALVTLTLPETLS